MLLKDILKENEETVPEIEPEIEKHQAEFDMLRKQLLSAPDLSPDEKEKEYLRYLGMKDPATGKPFKIPLLTYADPQYSTKYVEYMKMREYNPAGFKKVMEWS